MRDHAKVVVYIKAADARLLKAKRQDPAIWVRQQVASGLTRLRSDEPPPPTALTPAAPESISVTAPVGPRPPKGYSSEPFSIVCKSAHTAGIYCPECKGDRFR